jgi:hypothetical protein
MQQKIESQFPESNEKEKQVKLVRQVKYSRFLQLSSEEQEHHICEMLSSKPRTSEEWGAVDIYSFANGAGINPKAVMDMVERGLLPYFTVHEDVFVIVNLLYFPELSRAFQETLKAGQEKHASELGLTLTEWRKSLGYTDVE